MKMQKTTLILIAIIMIASHSLWAQISINTDGTDPDGSAILDVKSTNKGFLPPRMLAQERESISSPVTGLIIFCTDCGYSGGEPQYFNGTDWVNMIGGAVTEPQEIGDFALGGVVFYLDGSGGGLICSKDNLYGGSGIPWNNGVNTITGATDNAIGAGQANTAAIIGNQGVGTYAATLCTDYDDGSWFLPSKDEVNEMYLNKTAIETTAIANGGDAFIIGDRYWSSTEVSSFPNNARTQNIGTGVQIAIPKSNNARVRAIRAFPLNFSPEASDVSFSGVLKAGDTLTGSYTYFDSESDPEGNSLYQWYRSDDATGTNKEAISGAIALTYELSLNDIEKYISFQVIPIAQTGGLAGQATLSPYQGPVSSIGKPYQGGRIAYILLPGDPGYIEGEVHGLIAALSDQSSGISWIVGTAGYVAVNTSTALGAGQANTDLMIASLGYIGGAATICDDYTNSDTGTGVYSDWYLPSKDELYKLYLSYEILGGFSIYEWYWSSSEYDANILRAWFLQMLNGAQGHTNKYNVYKIRPVRSF